MNLSPQNLFSMRYNEKSLFRKTFVPMGSNPKKKHTLKYLLIIGIGS